MNVAIENIALISTAAEYFGRITSADFKLRSTMVSMAVWATRSYLTLSQRADADLTNVCRAAVVMATIRKWVHTVERDGFSLDLTSDSIRRSMGLHKELDIHAEACKVARNKCLQMRSAARFLEFYKNATASLEEQRRTNTELVEEIANMLSDTSINWEGEFIDCRGEPIMIEGAKEKKGHPGVFEGGILTDDDLYDEDAVETQADRIAETMAQVLEAMHVECERQFSGALTDSKINKLSAYKTSIERCMNAIGVNTNRLAQRQLALEQQLAAAESKLNEGVKSIDQDIEAQMAAAMAHVETAKVEETKPKRHRVPKVEAPLCEELSGKPWSEA